MLIYKVLYNSHNFNNSNIFIAQHTEIVSLFSLQTATDKKCGNELW